MKTKKSEKESAIEKQRDLVPNYDIISKVNETTDILSRIVPELLSVLQNLDIFNRALEKAIAGARTPYEEVNMLRDVLKTTKAQQINLQNKHQMLSEYLNNLPKKLEVLKNGN
jgi:hypothetical protein